MRLRVSGAWLVFIAVAITAAFYARFFTGFWLSDDFGNVHQQYLFAQRGELWTRALEFLYQPSQGAFYRPLMMSSLALNFAAAGTNYAGWFAVNLAVHLANTLLVALLVMRLSEWCGVDGWGSAWLAALAFGCCPALAEGVFWISARSDEWMTFFCLLGMLLWVGRPEQRSRALAFALPLLFVAALGFKEAAAVFPLQLAVVAIAWPVRLSPSRRASLIACFVLAALFIGLRALFFGNPLEIYPSRNEASLAERVWQMLASIGPWWRAMTASAPIAAMLYPLALAASAIALAFSLRGTRARLVLGLLAASAGMFAATLLNLGSMSAIGEGGRLTYNSAAWLFLAFGVALNRGQTTVSRIEEPTFRHVGNRGLSPVLGWVLFVGAIGCGMQVLRGELREAKTAQNEMRALAGAIAPWVATHEGFTLLLIDERRGPVVAGRGANASLVLRPVQREAIAHRVFPIMTSDAALSYDGLARGFITRITALKPVTIDRAIELSLYVPDTPRWPDHVACWAASRREIVAMERPDPSTRDTWADGLARGAERCRAP